MIPSESRASLGEVADTPVEQSGPPSRTDFVYVDIGSIDRERKMIVAAQTVPADVAPSRARQCLKAGDVLVSMTRPNLNAVAIVPANLDGAIGSTGFHILRSKWMVPEYLYFLVQSHDFIEAMCAVVQGALYPAVRPRDINAFEIRIPPRAKQTRIVDKLEELLSDLDAGVAELKAAQKKLAQYRQSLLKAAVEGRLTEAWRAQHEEHEESGAQLLARILRERRARWEAKQLAKFEAQGNVPSAGWHDKYSAPLTADKAALQELPKGWIWTTIDSLISEIQTGKSFKCEERPPRAGEIGVAKVCAVSWGDYNERESKTCLEGDKLNPSLFIRQGDFLFSRANTVELVGACVIAEHVSMRVMLSDKTLRFVFVVELMKHWLLFFLRSEFGRKQIELLASGNQESMRNIGQERIRQIAVPLPPAKELDEAIRNLATAFGEATAQEEAIRTSLRQSAAQRKNILQAAFSGQLVPQDPNDEPASVLLERIRAERTQHAARSKPDARKKRAALS